MDIEWPIQSQSLLFVLHRKTHLNTLSNSCLSFSVFLSTFVKDLPCDPSCICLLDRRPIDLTHLKLMQVSRLKRTFRVLFVAIPIITISIHRSSLPWSFYLSCYLRRCFLFLFLFYDRLHHLDFFNKIFACKINHFH